jgi:hypothetical protein
MKSWLMADGGTAARSIVPGTGYERVMRRCTINGDKPF